MKRCPKCDSDNIMINEFANLPTAVCRNCSEQFRISPDDLKEIQIENGDYYPQQIILDDVSKVAMNIPKVKVDISDAPVIAELKERGLLLSDDICIICSDAEVSSSAGGVLAANILGSLMFATSGVGFFVSPGSEKVISYYLFAVNKSELKLFSMQLTPKMITVGCNASATFRNEKGTAVRISTIRNPASASNNYVTAKFNIRFGSRKFNFFANLTFGGFKQRTEIERAMETINTYYSKK